MAAIGWRQTMPDPRHPMPRVVEVELEDVLVPVQEVVVVLVPVELVPAPWVP